jgi:hypothetical protein
MRDNADPADLLREAWCAVRLNAIRDFVGDTIARLGEISPDALLGRAVPTSTSKSTDPVWRALQTCSAELRSEAGMPDADEELAPGTTAAGEELSTHPRWASIYHEALGKYRSEAGKALRRWLDSQERPTCATQPER